MTPKQFALLIEKRASQKRISHMEAVLDYCQEKEIESANYLNFTILNIFYIRCEF